MGTSAPTLPVDRGGAGAGTGTSDPPVRRIAAALLGRRYVVDCSAALLFLAVAGWLGHGLWPDPATRVLTLNPEDQVLIEWFLAVDTRLLLGEHGLVTDRLNAPEGVNLLANASSPVLGFLLAPITLTFGAAVSFAVLTIGNLAATATAWYLLFARTLRVHRAAAAVGGGLCGFAPAMVSHANAHWHMTAQWLVPAIVWSVVRLVRAAEAATAGDGAPSRAAYRRVLTSALWLAGLVVAQYFLGAEVLYLTAVTLALVAIGYALARRRWAARVLPLVAAGLAVATGIAALVLAYPLWVQFRGPGSVPDGPFPADYFSADLASWVAFSPLTVAGSEATAYLATSAAEYNTFLGWPLLVVSAGCGAWLWHLPLVRAAVAAAAAMALLSLGPELVVDRVPTGLALPYAALEDVPVIDGALPQRYAMAVVPLLATLLVLALDRARPAPDRPTPDRPAPDRPVRGAASRPTLGAVLVGVGVGVGLLPLLPTPLPTGDRSPVPAFVSEGRWRDCVSPGGVLVPVPLPTPRAPEPMRWAATADAGFALPEGFFIGPYGPGGRASMGTAARPTSRLLAEVAATGEVPAIEPRHRREARRDLAYWGAECVALGPGQRYEGELRRVLVQLLGPGDRMADAWVWRVA